MSKKINDENDENIDKDAVEEEIKDTESIIEEQDTDDIKDLKKQLKESNSQLKETSSLLNKAMDLINNLTKGNKSNPDKEFENADKGVVEWRPGKPKTEVEEYLNERIPFFAFKDNDKYKDDIVVIINGYTYQIKRGVQVQIPRFVYNAIDDAERQRAAAVDHAQGLIDEFDKKTKQYGITL